MSTPPLSPNRRVHWALGTRQYLVRGRQPSHEMRRLCPGGGECWCIFHGRTAPPFHSFSFFVSCVHCGYFHPSSCLGAAPQQVLGPLRPGAHLPQGAVLQLPGVKLGLLALLSWPGCDVGRERGGRYPNQLSAPSLYLVTPAAVLQPTLVSVPADLWEEASWGPWRRPVSVHCGLCMCVFWCLGSLCFALYQHDSHPVSSFQ